MTWKLDVTNSVFLLIHFGLKLLLHGITYLVQDISIYTGDWFCYLSKFIAYYLTLNTLAHSLVVSILKYLQIVHWGTSLEVGKEKIREIFFYLNFLHPIITISFHLIVRPDFFLAYDAYAEIDRCLGDPKNNWKENSNSSQTKLHNMCIFSAPTTEYTSKYILQAAGWGMCWFQVMVLYLISFNFFEILFYCRIFSFMRR